MIMMEVPKTARSIEERLRGYVQALIQRRRKLQQINLIYRDQARIYPLQVDAIASHLENMRRAVRGCQAFLQRLDPLETARLKPFACILKLGSLDCLLTELLLNVAMHAEVCATVSDARVHIHLTIRASLPAALVSYDDTIAMLTALSSKNTEDQL